MSSGADSQIPSLIQDAFAQRLAASEAQGARRRRPGTLKKTTRNSKNADASKSADAESFVPLAAAISELVQRKNWQHSKQVAELALAWSDLVGPEFAQHVQFVSLQDRILRVRASSGNWATQAQILQQTILERINSQVGRKIVERLEIVG